MSVAQPGSFKIKTNMVIVKCWPPGFGCAWRRSTVAWGGPSGIICLGRLRWTENGAVIALPHSRWSLKLFLLLLQLLQIAIEVAVGRTWHW